MLSRGYGRIVLTSSVTGPITGHPGFSAYGASKAAMLGFMRSAAVELATRGVTINAVMPGNVATPGLASTGEEHTRLMLSAIPMGRFAEPDDVGWAVRFLASVEAGYITGPDPGRRRRSGASRRHLPPPGTNPAGRRKSATTLHIALALLPVGLVRRFMKHHKLAARDPLGDHARAGRGQLVVCTDRDQRRDVDRSDPVR